MILLLANNELTECGNLSDWALSYTAWHSRRREKAFLKRLAVNAAFVAGEGHRLFASFGMASQRVFKFISCKIRSTVMNRNIILSLLHVVAHETPTKAGLPLHIERSQGYIQSSHNRP